MAPNADGVFCSHSFHEGNSYFVKVIYSTQVKLNRLNKPEVHLQLSRSIPGSDASQLHVHDSDFPLRRIYC